MKHECDALVKIGGSIFMDEPKTGNEILFYADKEPDFAIRSSLQNENSFVIGANLGPVFSQTYWNRVKETLKKHGHVCLRDYSSFYMVKELTHVQYAPDVLFNIPQPLSKKNKKTVVISVIDISKHTNDTLIVQSYFDKLAETVIYFVKSKMPVTLVSFCKSEGDEKAIARLLSKISDHSNIHTHFYRGNTDSLLSLLSESSFIVGSRFHSIILGISFGKPVYPICYNCKTKHYLSDLYFKGKYAELIDLPSIKVEDIIYNYRHNIITDCTTHKKYAKNQFWGLRQYIDSLP